MLLEALHQVRALHAVHVSGPVVHLGGGHQLTALGHAGDQQGFEVGASGVDRGGIAGRAGAKNENLGVLGRGHEQRNKLEGNRTVRMNRACMALRRRRQTGWRTTRLQRRGAKSCIVENASWPRQEEGG